MAAALGVGCIGPTVGSGSCGRCAWAISRGLLLKPPRRNSRGQGLLGGLGQRRALGLGTTVQNKEDSLVGAERLASYNLPWLGKVSGMLMAVRAAANLRQWDDVRLCCTLKNCGGFNLCCNAPMLSAAARIQPQPRSQTPSH